MKVIIKRHLTNLFSCIASWNLFIEAKLQQLVLMKLLHYSGNLTVDTFVTMLKVPVMVGVQVFAARIHDVQKCARKTPRTKLMQKIVYSAKSKDLRPISLTSTLSKICERFATDWLFESIRPKIDIRQYGSIKKCSTTHALLSLVHLLSPEYDGRFELCGEIILA